jgi:hypothetical protein
VKADEGQVITCHVMHAETIGDNKPSPHALYFHLDK